MLDVGGASIPEFCAHPLFAILDGGAPIFMGAGGKFATDDGGSPVGANDFEVGGKNCGWFCK